MKRVTRTAAAAASATVSAAVSAIVLFAAPAVAQDIRGLEMCTAEKQMDRRTGCLQANDSFLQQELAKVRRDSDARLAAAQTEIAALKAALARLDDDMKKLRAKAEPGKTEPAAPK